MDTVMLELSNAIDKQSGKSCAAWIEVRREGTGGRRTNLYFAAGSRAQTATTFFVKHELAGQEV
jgi:hypothetical protein